MSRYSAGFDHDDPFHSEPEWRVQQRQADALERIADALESLACSVAQPGPDRGDVLCQVYDMAETITKVCTAYMDQDGGGEG